jgi:hypothetical protein
VNIPGIFLGTILAICCGLIFHLFRGGRLSRFALYLATAWVSFFAGNLVGVWLDWSFLQVGELRLFPALLATVLGLIIASVLAGPEKKAPPRQRHRKTPPE